MAEEDDEPWVELGFPRLVEVTQVRLWETFQPGGLLAIKARENKAYGDQEDWITLWEAPVDDAETLDESRIFTPILQRQCRANALRLELTGCDRGLDAVQIEGVAL